MNKYFCLKFKFSFISLLITTGLLLFPRRAGAVFDTLELQGVRSATMAGAVIAGSDDHWAAWYNVANIGGQGRHLQVSLDTAGLYNAATYVRRDDGRLAYSNTLQPQIAGGISGIIGPNNCRVALALNYYPLYQARQNYNPATVAGHTVVNDSSNRLHVLQFSAALKFRKFLAVGLGLQNYFAILSPEIFTAAGNISSLNSKNYLNPSATLGLTITPTINWAIAFSSHLPLDITADYDDFSTIYHLPAIYRLGVRYTLPARWALELAAVYEDLQDQDFGGQWLKRHDRFSVNFGASYQLMEPLELRAGFMFQSNSVAAENLSVYNFDSNKVALGLGAAWKFPAGIRLDVGYSYYYFVARNEAVSRVGAILAGDQNLPAVGNGTYGYGIHHFGLELSFEL